MFHLINIPAFLLNRSLVVFITNLVVFQVAWFINVATDLYLGAGVSIFCISLHFYVLHQVLKTSGKLIYREVLWLVMVVVFGWLVETVLIMASALKIESAPVSVGLVPVWLLLIWACFATTFRFSMNYFVQHPGWALPVGSLATLSYASGVALNSTVSFGRDAPTALLIIAGLWSIVFALMCATYRRYWEAPCLPHSC